MKKFKNFLYYEWKKILAVVFVIVLTVVSVKQCNSKVVTDLGILYVSGINPGELDPLVKNIEKANIVADTDSDGKITIGSRVVLITPDNAINLEQQIPQQIQMEIISGENHLFFVNEDTLHTHMADLSFADISETVAKWNIPAEKCRSYENGDICAVSLEGNKLLEGLGINTDGMFVAQRNYLLKDKNNPLNQNAAKALDYILTNF